MSQLQLIDAACQIKQAQAVLRVWLENATNKTDSDLPCLIGSIMTLLHGVQEAISEAESQLHDHVMSEYREGKA
ncbi:hypothetical protein KC928_16515 [Enterobacter cloacae]|uniref:hypothetical protein n=1 Tax=Enterobacter cloacae TaxID=550 RepID=UPI003314F3CB